MSGLNAVWFMAGARRSGASWRRGLHLLEGGRGGAKMRREVTRQRSRSPALGPTPKAQTAAGSSGCPSVSPALRRLGLPAPTRDGVLRDREGRPRRAQVLELDGGWGQRIGAGLGGSAANNMERVPRDEIGSPSNQNGVGRGCK